VATERPEVSVVIPNYEGRSILPETLAALQTALGETSIRSEVIVVDDASRDGSPEQTERDHPHVRLLRKDRQEGFGPTVNLGVREARAPLVYLLNSDVSVRPGFLPPLVAQLGEPERFAAVSLNIGSDDRVAPPHVVAPQLKRGQIRMRGLDLNELWRSKRLEECEPLETFFGIGGSILVRRERFLALDGFADAFSPYYYEDADLCWRAWRRGWPTVLASRSVVTHREGGSIASTQRLRHVKVIRKRNRFLLLWRNLLDPDTFRRQHLLRLPGYVAGSLLRGDLTVVRGLGAALRRRAEIAEHRARERQAMVLSDAEIFARVEATRTRLLSGGT
jgi:GT2 family glycosyltransferase